MAELIPITQPTSMTRDLRRTSRGILRSRSFAQLRLATIADETDVALEKVEAVTAVTGQGMSAVCKVAQAQRNWEAQTPEASSRLNFMADAHSVAVGECLSDLGRTLRRC